MSTIVSHVRLVILRPKTADEDMVAKWAEFLKANAERINLNRKAIIKNEAEFQKMIAAASQKVWPPFVNPGFRSKSGQDAAKIIGSRYANLKEAYEMYNRKLNDAFATVDGIPAKRFKDSVDSAKGDFSKGIAKRTLPFTGSFAIGRGPAAIAALWLANDARVENYLRAGDSVLQGGPYRITKSGMEPAFKAALTGRIIQSGANIIKMERGLPIRTDENNLTNSLIQGYIDPALGLESFTTGGASHVDFIVDNNELYLDIQVSQV